MACADWWVFCMTLGFPAAFQLFRLQFLNFLPLLFPPLLFPISLLIAPSLFFSACSYNCSNFVPAIFLFQFALHFFEVCFSFPFPSISFFFSFVICCKFLIFPLSLFFYRCDCLCFLAFGVLVFTSPFCVFSGCPWLVVLRLG